jgi:hypothetical protein
MDSFPLMCANANPGNPTINGMGPWLVTAAAYTNDCVIPIPSNLAHTVAASEFASSVRIANVSALVDQYAAQSGNRHSYALSALSRSAAGLSRGNPFSIFPRFFLEIDSVNAEEKFVLTVSLNFHIVWVVPARHR